jgi:hypothetical protein
MDTGPNTTAPLKLAHLVFFKLTDRSPVTMERFLKHCRDFLSEHRGQIHFSLGVRAPEMTRDVNVLDFDVSMNMVFESIDSYMAYRTHQRHLDFITESAGLSVSRRVYDSYLEDEEHTEKQMPMPARCSARD